MDDYLENIPLVFEDFYPVNRSIALVVSGGRNWNKKTEFRDYMNNKFAAVVFYRTHEDDVHLSPVSKIAVEGTHIRLGNYPVEGGSLCYSDAGKIFLGNDYLRDGEQPFMNGSDLYYTFESEIWKNEKKFISLFDEFTEVCHPTIYEGTIFFECLRGKAPEGWEVWSADLKTLTKKFVCIGANPYAFDGYLYFSWWDETNVILRTKRKKL